MGAQRLIESARIAVAVEERARRESGLPPRSVALLERRARRLALERQDEASERLDSLADVLRFHEAFIESHTKTLMLEARQSDLLRKLAAVADPASEQELQAVKTELFVLAEYSNRAEDDYEDALEDLKKLIR